MNADIIIGLRIGLIGLGVTFLALGILSIVMKYLPRLFPPQKNEPAKPSSSPAGEVQQEHQLEEMAVALAVGICLLEEQNALAYHDPNLGKLLEIQ